MTTRLGSAAMVVLAEAVGDRDGEGGVIGGGRLAGIGIEGERIAAQPGGSPPPSAASPPRDRPARKKGVLVSGLVQGVSTIR